MSIWLYLSVAVNVLLGVAYIKLGLSKKDKNRRIPYIFWGIAFLALFLWTVVALLYRNDIINSNLATPFTLVAFVLFIIFMYLGTIFIFTKTIKIGLTYFLLAPVVLMPVILSFISADSILAGALPGFLIIIPIDVVLAILSWFLGISSFPNPKKLFTWWIIGIVWILNIVHTAIVSISPIFGQTTVEMLYTVPSTVIFAATMGAVFQAAFLFLLYLNIFAKEESF